MVNFNQEQALMTAPNDMIKMIILEKRYNFLDSYEKLLENKFRNSSSKLYEVKARLLNLMIEVSQIIKVSEKEDIINPLKVETIEALEEEIPIIFDKLDALLFKYGLLNILKETYDKTSIAEEDKRKGL